MIQLAAEYEVATGVSVTHAAINKHFKKLGVPRDLRAKIQAKAAAMVSAAMVSGKVSIDTIPADAEIINRCAIDVATVQLSHRTDIRRYRDLCQSMMIELEAETQNMELFANLGEILATSDENTSKLNEIYRKVISLPQRIDGVKKLAETLKTLIGLEREAFGIDERKPMDGKPAMVSITF